MGSQSSEIRRGLDVMIIVIALLLLTVKVFPEIADAPIIQIKSPETWSFIEYSGENPMFVGLEVQILLGTERNEDILHLKSSKLCIQVNGTGLEQDPCTSVGMLLAQPEGFGVWVTRPGIQWVTVHLKSGDAEAQTCSPPIAIRAGPSPSLFQAPQNLLTAVLTLTLEDLGRAAVMLASLHYQNFMDLFAELLIIVPDNEVFAFRTLFAGEAFQAVQIVEESTLFPSGIFTKSWDSYALQMSLKLLISQWVKTEFYLTLDADLIATRKTPRIDEMIMDGKANYIPESRGVHPHWWAGSEALVQISMDSKLWDDGFGVTPAILSTPGVLFVLNRLKELYGEQYHQDWLGAWGSHIWWSEYTLYRIVLDDVGIFDTLHDASNAGFVPLTCHNVWFDGDLPWDAQSAFEDNGGCLFSVLQSTSGISSGSIADQLANFFP